MIESSATLGQKAAALQAATSEIGRHNRRNDNEILRATRFFLLASRQL